MRDLGLLDPTAFPAWRDAIARADAAPGAHEPRSYPGYPTIALPRGGRWTIRMSLADALTNRRCARRLATELPATTRLGRILQLAHGVTGDAGRGPTPSAGGLQAIELYVIGLADAGWLPRAVYHYDRRQHHLARVADAPERGTCSDTWLPSLATVDGGALVWLVVGDGARVAAKYGARGSRFVLNEAGHLMQNLCLASHAAGLCTVPLGGYYERVIADALKLPPEDQVVGAGLCGRAIGSR